VPQVAFRAPAIRIAFTRAAFVRRAWSVSAIALLGSLPVLAGCGAAGGSSPSAVLPQAGAVQVRFVEGAPSLEAIVNGTPTDLGAAYLRVNGQTVASTFPYGSVTPFSPVSAGVLAVEALDGLGYSVGPLKTPPLAAGKRYSVAVVGTYPRYRALAFEEPSGADGATLAVYAASPQFPSADFGKFRASSRSDFIKLGSVRFGSVAAVGLAETVSNFGAYVGTGTTPISGGALTLSSVDPFDAHDALPFHNAARASLFLLDPQPGTGSGPVFGSLDR
jgi:hypothetical protein